MASRSIRRATCSSPGRAAPWIIAPDGNHLGTIRGPELPANCAWGDADGRTLYMTARTGLYRIRTNIPGTDPRLDRPRRCRPEPRPAPASCSAATKRALHLEGHQYAGSKNAGPYDPPGVGGAHVMHVLQVRAAQGGQPRTPPDQRRSAAPPAHPLPESQPEERGVAVHGRRQDPIQAEEAGGNATGRDGEQDQPAATASKINMTPRALVG